MVATLIVGGTIHNTGYLRPTDGTGTHGAGLNGNIQCTLGKILATQRVGSGSNGLHLGMGGNIAQRFGEVVRTRHYPILTHHHGTNGYLARLKRQMGLV